MKGRFFMSGKKIGSFDALGMKGNIFDIGSLIRIALGFAVVATLAGVGLKGATMLNQRVGWFDTGIVNPIRSGTVATTPPPKRVI